MDENENEEENDTEEKFYFNGINGDSGNYDLPPMTGSELYSLIIGEEEPENINELRYRHQQDSSSDLGVREGIDLKVLGGDNGAGWGVIFHRDADPAIKEAMSELLVLREEQAGERFRLYEGGAGFRPKDSKTKFLARHKAGPGPADPEVVPYYLLIVGSPEEIPYRFQTQLDVDYAVGRIHFDTLDEYANYARSVVDSEKGGVKLPREMSFFGVANDDDRATQLSSQNLVLPVQKKLQGEYQDWRYSAFMGDDAIKKNLAALLGGEKTPALLFSASHGMSFPIERNRQLDHQGAILCQDWPGPREWEGAISQDHYFAGDDLSSDANLLGLVAFFFACYGAGTPHYDEFSKLSKRGRRAIAPNPFMAKLPEKMLGHPNGGALAVIGHVERAWGYSFMWPKAGKQTAVFEDT